MPWTCEGRRHPPLGSCRWYDWHLAGLCPLGHLLGQWRWAGQQMSPGCHSQSHSGSHPLGLHLRTHTWK